MSGKRGNPGVLGLPGAQGPPGFKVSFLTQFICRPCKVTRLWINTRGLAEVARRSLLEALKSSPGVVFGEVAELELPQAVLCARSDQKG